MPRHFPVTPEQLETAKQMLADGHSLSTIGLQLKKSKTTIRKALGIPEPEKKAVSKNIFNWADYKYGVI